VNGVKFMRFKLHPVAECRHVHCGWTFEGRSYIGPVAVRNSAKNHVLANPRHLVTVTVKDVTEYRRDDHGVTP
jgi:hypothetical protein